MKIINIATLRSHLLKMADSVEANDQVRMGSGVNELCDLLLREQRLAIVVPGLDPRKTADAIRRYANGEHDIAAYSAIPEQLEIAASRFESSKTHIAKVALAGVHSGYSQNASSLPGAVFAAFLRCLARIATELED